MSPFSHRFTISASHARSVAIVALLGATLLVSPLTAAHAADATPATPIQAPQTSPPQAGVEAANSQIETVEQRITNLRAALKITPEQDVKWAAVAQAMRDNASAMEKLITESAHAPQGMIEKLMGDKPTPVALNPTAVEDLTSYEKFTQAHVDGLKNLIPAFETLYTSMPDAQKKIADDVFQNFGRKGEASHN